MTFGYLLRDAGLAKPRVLVVGQGGNATGYARVLESLAGYLKDDFDLVYFAISDYGDVSRDTTWKLEINQMLGDKYGCLQLPGLLRKYRPDLVLMCDDLGFYELHEEALRHYEGITVVYCPIDTPVDSSRLRALSYADVVVTYTHFGFNMVSQAFEQERSRGVHVGSPRMYILPHGVETSQFYPLTSQPLQKQGLTRERRHARMSMFPDRPELQDAFIVLNANRNGQRKRVDITLEAFAEFAHGKPDVYLYLHMGMRDCGVDVLKLASEYSIMDRLLTTTRDRQRPRTNEIDLNLIYNSADVGLNTSSGEGWGLVAFEHAATGAAQVVPDHSACGELWRAEGICIPSKPETGNMPVVSAKTTAQVLEELYTSPVYLEDRSWQAYQYATSLEWRWQEIAKRWKELFHQELQRLEEKTH
ncbi:glycosyltransferase family protein [Paenibacillus vandeheii]